MSPRKTNPPETVNQKPKPKLSTSQERERHFEEAKHHPEEHLQPHVPHHPQEKPTLPKRHHPHTQPPEYTLDIDHGSHEDRPRPGKIAKKGNKKGSPR